MTIKEIIIDYLKKNGFDGLCSEGCACGFETGDLFYVCKNSPLSCTPAYKKSFIECNNACDAKDICPTFRDMSETHLYCTRKPE